MTADTHQDPWIRGIVRLPGCVLLMMCVCFIVSFLTERSMLDQSATLLALLLPLLWLMAQPTVRICDGLIERWFLLAILFLVWMAGVQYFSPTAMPAGWIRFADRAAALATCLLVVVRQVPPREMISLIGTSAACVTVISLVMDSRFDQLQALSIVNFGFGHVNILTDLAGPSLLAWAALLAGDSLSGRRVRIRDLVVVGCGMVAMAIIAIATARRGIFVAAALASLWPLTAWLWQRKRPLAILLITAVAVVAGVVAVHLISEDPPSMRNERMNVYRAAIDGVVSGLPFGFGQYGMIHVMLLNDESCRHLCACGGWLQHAHNEFLDIAIDGGPVALALALALTVLVAIRLTRIRDPQVRMALQMMGIAIAVHLMTDHVFGVSSAQLWLGAVVGMMLGAPVAGVQTRALHLLPRVRLLAWSFALVACWGALHHSYPAFMHAEAEPEIRMRCLEQALEPQTVDAQVGELMGGGLVAVSEASSDAVFAMATRKTGWTGRSAISFSVSQAIKFGHAQEATTALLRLLAIVPFYRGGYEQLAFIIAHHAECAPNVPEVIRRRLGYISGTATLTPPDAIGAPHTIDAAIDAYAMIIWSMTNHRPWASIAGPLQSLCQRYGDIPGVAQLVAQAALEAPAGTFPWLDAEIPVLEAGLRVGFDEVSFLTAVKTRQQALVLLPLIQARYPAVVRDVRAGACTTLADKIELRNAVVRMLALARPPDPSPPGR